LLTKQDLLNSEISLCFDDILLVPHYSDLESRTEPDVSTKLGHLTLSLPIVSAPMDTITRSQMLIAMSSNGGLGILTRFIKLPDLLPEGVIDEESLQIWEIKTAKSLSSERIGCAIGIRNNPQEHAKKLLEYGCDVICIDVAHGDHKKVYESIEQVSKLKNNFTFSLMAGNICTREATRRYINAGVDITRTGIGPGACCTTRRVTGFGIPQLTAILQCADEAKGRTAILADGGIRETGDIIKSLWAGADACMTGYMLAGTSSTPDIGSEKMYRGMSSRTVHQRKDVAAEGIDIRFYYNGDTGMKLKEYKQGIQSGLAMAGASNIEELRKSEFTRVSVFTMKESNPVTF